MPLSNESECAPPAFAAVWKNGEGFDMPHLSRVKVRCPFGRLLNLLKLGHNVLVRSRACHRVVSATVQAGAGGGWGTFDKRTLPRHACHPVGNEHVKSFGLELLCRALGSLQKCLKMRQF